MTISSTTIKAGPYTPSGTTGPYAFSFKTFDNTQVRVVRTSAAGIESDLVLTSGYTVALNADQDNTPGGTITTVATYSDGLVTIVSNADYKQQTDLTSAGGFYPQTVEDMVDKLALEVQQVKEAVDRAVKVAISSSTSPDALIASLVAAAAAAAASATAAAGSATAASGSATAAAASATAAAASAASFINGVNTFTAAQRGQFVTLTDAATIALDFSLANNFRVNLGGNRTLGVPTNIGEGQSGIIRIIQDNTGSRTLAYSWAWQFTGATAPVISTAAWSRDDLSYSVDVYKSAPVTITIASPGVVTHTAHGLYGNQPVQLTTTGALPTGIAASTTLYVVGSSITTNTYQLSLTAGGAAINTSGSQSGVHTLTAISITASVLKDIR